MATSQYPNLNENQFAGLLQVATAAADAQERRATALGKRKRDDEAFIDHQLRTPTGDMHHDDQEMTPTLQSSAAVLFREPSEKSKKYSRPPLGKVYTDLEMAPEMFLQLQGAAKDFMLDPAHPERKAVVGQKKQNSNNDVAKLKLWTCVEEFLHTPSEKTTELNCEYYFGHSAGASIPNQPVRTFFWPEDRDQVIKMCMPLFRKMVTNERQRIYASETRKQDPGKPETNKKTNNAYVTDQFNLFLTQARTSTNTNTTLNQVVLHVNVVAKEGDNQGRRITDRISMPSTLAQSQQALLEEVRKRYDLPGPIAPAETSSSSPDEGVGVASEDEITIKAWLEQGLVPIRNQNEWMMALLSAETVDWMDNELRVIIEV